MRITADTNLMVRAIVADDAEQAALAQAVLARAEVVALPLSMLCELVWVLRRGYRRTPADIAAVLRRLLTSTAVSVDRPAAEAGLAVLEAGGDFADGIIAHEGRILGATTFVSFDRKAVALLSKAGLPAEPPS